MKLPFRKKKSFWASVFDHRWLAPLLLVIGLLLGVALTWVTLISWDQLNTNIIAPCSIWR